MNSRRIDATKISFSSISDVESVAMKKRSESEKFCHLRYEDGAGVGQSGDPGQLVRT